MGKGISDSCRGGFCPGWGGARVTVFPVSYGVDPVTGEADLTDVGPGGLVVCGAEYTLEGFAKLLAQAGASLWMCPPPAPDADGDGD
jgi:hypothetical protein